MSEGSEVSGDTKPSFTVRRVGGRPPLPPERKRGGRVKPSYTDAEFAQLYAEARARSLSISEWVRVKSLRPAG